MPNRSLLNWLPRGIGAACEVGERPGDVIQFRSMMRNLVLTIVVGSALLTAQPAKNVSAARHPNLAAAQRLTAQAFAKISAAQTANEFDMKGHAAKAKELLDQANNELKQAAEAANRK